jgi:hypothetical protein
MIQTTASISPPKPRTEIPAKVLKSQPRIPSEIPTTTMVARLANGQ